MCVCTCTGPSTCVTCVKCVPLHLALELLRRHAQVHIAREPLVLALCCELGANLRRAIPTAHNLASGRLCASCLHTRGPRLGHCIALALQGELCCLPFTRLLLLLGRQRPRLALGLESLIHRPLRCPRLRRSSCRLPRAAPVSARSRGSGDCIAAHIRAGSKAGSDAEPTVCCTAAVSSPASCCANTSSRSRLTSGSPEPPPAMRRFASAFACATVRRPRVLPPRAGCGAGSPASANICAAEMSCPLAVGMPSGLTSQGCSLTLQLFMLDSEGPWLARLASTCCAAGAGLAAPPESCDAIAAATGSKESSVRPPAP